MIISEKEYKLGEYESLTIIDSWEEDSERLYIKVQILNQEDALYRISFVNKLVKDILIS